MRTLCNSLIVAAGLGPADRVRSLLAGGAAPLCVEPRMGATALHRAAQSGSAETVRLLLDHEAFVDVQSPILGNTPLMDAVLHKRGEVVRLLLERGAGTAIRNHWGQTALDLAQADRLDAIARMIEGRVADDAEKVRAALLISAVTAGDADRVGRLLADGADVGARRPILGDPNDDHTSLGLAARDGDVQIVRLLLDAGADPRQHTGAMRGTPVHEAAYFGHADIVRMLAAHRPAPDLDAQGPYNGMTALHDAVWHGHAEAARALIEAGARLDLRTHTGETARDLAVAYGYADIARILADADPVPMLHKHVDANGVSLHVIEQGQGPAVLFVHGFPDTAETWRSQMRAVATAGYRAIALDMRGFGESDAPDDPDLYSGLHVAGDLVAVLDALDVPQAVVVGHDWGADHAQRAALMRPDRFRALVSLSIPYAPRGETSVWGQLRAQGLGKRYYAFGMMAAGADAHFRPAARSIPSILYWLSASPAPDARWDPIDPARSMLRPAPVAVPDWADPAYVRHLVATFERTGFDGGLNHYRALQATFDLMAAFKHAPIRQPSLYLWGAADGLCQLFHPEPPATAELRRVQPGLVDVICLEGVGHWPQHEASDRVNAALLGFLTNLPPYGGDG